MVWLAIVFLLAVAVAILVAREPLARMQAMLMGGHMGPGCVIAEAALLVVIAILVVVFRREF